MHWVWIALGVAYFLFNVWIIWDALDHTGYGCAWMAFFFFVPLISQAIYLFMRFYANRADIDPGLALGKTSQQDFSRFPTEIEKARFIEAADRSFGTMYEPGASSDAVGYPHFRDDRAEIFLNDGRFDEAWDYLIELYSVAKSEGDGRGEDTYLHYISRLPDGQNMLVRWRRERHMEIGGGHDDNQAPPSAGPPNSRDVPF